MSVRLQAVLLDHNAGDTSQNHARSGSFAFSVAMPAISGMFKEISWRSRNLVLFFFEM